MDNTQQIYGTLLVPYIKRLIAETVNAIPAELRICDRLEPHGVFIDNGEIVFATGKRIDGYTAKKFYDAFESVLNSINTEIVEELIQYLQKDAMVYYAKCSSVIYGCQLWNWLPQMYQKYQMIVESTKYRTIHLITTFVRPMNEFFRIPFMVDARKTIEHVFFFINFERYVNFLNYVNMGGSIRQLYEDTRCAARCNVAVKAKERHGERRSVTASKPCNHLLPSGVQAPTKLVT